MSSTWNPALDQVGVRQEKYWKGADVLHVRQHIEDIDWMREAISKKLGTSPQRAVEIGLLQGGSHVLWRSIFNQVTTIEMDKNVASRFSEHATDGSNVIVGQSQDLATYKSVVECLGGPVDFLFIDGDHTYEGVAGDFLLYSRLVRPGGMIGFHDTNTAPPNHRPGGQGQLYGVVPFIEEVRTGVWGRDCSDWFHGPKGTAGVGYFSVDEDATCHL